jgi:hypothetical protein
VYFNAKVVVDIATNTVEHRERTPYSGPWELCKESSAEKQARLSLQDLQTKAAQSYYNVDLPAQRKAEQERLDLERTSMGQQTTQFNTMRQMMLDELARQHGISDPVIKSMTPYLTATEGYDPAIKRMMGDEAISDISRGYGSAYGDVRAALRARGSGGGDLPVGGDFARGIAELAGGKADAISTARRTINLDSVKQALANKFNASSVLMGGAGMAGGNVGVGSGARPMTVGDFSAPAIAPTNLAPPKPPSFWGNLGQALITGGINTGAQLLGGWAGMKLGIPQPAYGR